MSEYFFYCLTTNHFHRQILIHESSFLICARSVIHYTVAQNCRFPFEEWSISFNRPYLGMMTTWVFFLLVGLGGGLFRVCVDHANFWERLELLEFQFVWIMLVCSL